MNIFIVSSGLTDSWVDEFMSKANGAGCNVLDTRLNTSISEPDFEDGQPDFLICNLLNAADAFAPAPWMVVSDDPGNGVGFFERNGLSLKEAIQRTASEHAASSLLSSLGAPCFDIRKDIIYLDGFESFTFEPRRNDEPNQSCDVLSMYVPGFAGETIWPVSLFETDSSAQRLDNSVAFDLTGRSRWLIHGPHIDLPPGYWEVHAKIFVDPFNSQANLIVDWGVGGVDIVSWSGVIKKRGWYDVKLRKEWSNIGAAQFRILTHPAFEGKVVFAGCYIRSPPNSK